MQTEHKSRLRRTLAWGLLVAFVAFAAAYLVRNPRYLDGLWSLPPQVSVLLLALSVLVFVFLAGQLEAMARIHGADLLPQEAFALAVANNFLNYMPAKAGLVARGAYLGVVHGMTATRYIAAVTTGQLLWMLLVAALGLGAVLPMLAAGAAAAGLWLLGGLFLAVTVAAAIAMASAGLLSRYFSDRRFVHRLGRVAEGVSLWRRRPGVAVLFLAFSLLTLLASGIRLWIAFLAADVSMSAADLLLLQASVGIGFAFSFLPGNIGVREGVLVGVAVLLGAPAEGALAAAILDRVAAMLIAFSLGPWFVHRLASRAMAVHAR